MRRRHWSDSVWFYVTFETLLFCVIAGYLYAVIVTVVPPGKELATAAVAAIFPWAILGRSRRPIHEIMKRMR